MNKSSAGLFSIWPRDEMKSGSVGKVLPPKRMTLMGKVLKKWYTVKELVPLYTKKKHQKHEKEHPENIRKSPVFHFAMSRMSLLQPCLQQFQNRLPRSTELVGGFPGIGVKQKLGFAIIIFSGSFHKQSKETFGEFGFEFHTWKCLSSRWIFRIRVSKPGHPRVTELPVAFLVARPLCVACCQKTPRWTRWRMRRVGLGNDPLGEKLLQWIHMTLF